MFILNSNCFCCFLSNGLNGSIVSYSPEQGSKLFNNNGDPELHSFFKTTILLVETDLAWKELMYSSPLGKPTYPTYKNLEGYVLVTNMSNGWAVKDLLFEDLLEKRKYLEQAEYLPDVFVIENAPVIFSLGEINHFYEAVASNG